MAGPGLTPVGVAPDRIEPQLNLHLAQLQIPKQAVERSRPQDQSSREDKRVEGWHQQESLVQSQGELRQEKRDNWRRFESGTRRSNYGAIQIDGPNQPKKTLAPITAGTAEGGGWGRIDQWHQHAARFEEKNRSSTDRIGGEDAQLDPSSPTPAVRGGQGKKRRRYTIA